MTCRLRAIAAGLTDVGLQREHNEDSFVIVGADGPFVVADGMGGHRAGDVASQIATESIAEFFGVKDAENPNSDDNDGRLTPDERRLLASIRTANRRILERSARSRDLHGMGTTVVGALYDPEDGRMVIAHVGDSRAYRLRGGLITQMTRDHSLFNDYLMAMPDLSEEQRSELPRNVITRALGMQNDIVVDLQSDQAMEGDVYVLCSDGLSGMVDDDDIVEIVSRASDLQDACRLLVRRANENGGEDNVTAIVVRIDCEQESSEESGDRTRQPDATTVRAVALDTADTPPAGPTLPRD